MAHLPPGTPRDYGLAGGTICPHCHRPFPLSFLMLKVGFGTKLTRCEFCGKWSFVSRKSLDELRAAEAAELVEAQAGQSIQGKSESEKLQDKLADSRFTDKS